jgi:hypothetical protein
MGRHRGQDDLTKGNQGGAMKPTIFACVFLVSACKKEEHQVWTSGDTTVYTEPVPGRAPTENMVRVPVSADGLIKEFFIDKNEVTAGEYSHCVGMKRCDAIADIEACDTERVHPGSTPKRPVNCVSPKMADEYCAYRGKRLPTRDEWLRAARGDDGRPFPWGAAPPTCKTAVIHDTQCPSEHAEDVGSRPDGASPYGALDMVGNVSEIVYVPPPLRGQGDYVVMGGNYATAPGTLAQVGLQGEAGTWWAPQYGFRCAWSPDPLKPSPGK